MGRYKKKKIDGIWHYVEKDKVVIKDVKHFYLMPGHDENNVLKEGRFFEAIFMTAIRIERYLKDLYFWKDCKNNTAIFAMVDNMNFYNIIELGRGLGYITSSESDNIHMLRRARNEVAHYPYAHNRYVDGDKTKKIIEPCIKIINRLHDKMKEIK